MSATTDTLNALIAELRAKGVNLGIDQDELTVRAPKGVMTPELAAQLRAQKPLLLDYYDKPNSERKHPQRLSPWQINTIGNDSPMVNDVFGSLTA